MSKKSLKQIALAARAATPQMATASSQRKNDALKEIADLLRRRRDEVLAANRADIESAQTAGLSPSLIDRLSIQGDRLEGIISDLHQVVQLPDPIGELFDETTGPNQLAIAKCRTPLGVLGVIYESRPNVTLDVSSLSIKSGNCAILRGGSETLQTNQLLVETIQNALKATKLPKEAIQLVPNPDRKQIKKLLQLHDLVDLIIPRGGSALHSFCRENSKIPVITGGIGICHLFADESADLSKSLPVVANAKVQRPTVCNALDTLLVHQKIAPTFVPLVVRALQAQGVSFRLDPLAWKLLPHPETLCCHPAGPDDWDTEWLSLILGIKVVQNIDEAIEHIFQHSTHHSDGILTEDEAHAARFVKEVDSAAVYVNASTRFTDGGQLGLGAEVAISTQKIHARGPMGLRELTSYKWIVRGSYSVRGGTA